MWDVQMVLICPPVVRREVSHLTIHTAVIRSLCNRQINCNICVIVWYVKIKLIVSKINTFICFLYLKIYSICFTNLHSLLHCHLTSHLPILLNLSSRAHRFYTFRMWSWHELTVGLPVEMCLCSSVLFICLLCTVVTLLAQLMFNRGQP